MAFDHFDFQVRLGGLGIFLFVLGALSQLGQNSSIPESEQPKWRRYMLYTCGILFFIILFIAGLEAWYWEITTDASLIKGAFSMMRHGKNAKVK